MNLIDNKYIDGIFISESKNRFICLVMIEDEIHECYVSSSARLENFISLKNKRVLLLENKGTAKRTKYSLFAMYHRNKLILLNLNTVNTMFEMVIESGRYKEYLGYESIKREAIINGYKSDLYLYGIDKIIIENKSIISVKKEASFPSVYSERSIMQLKKLYVILNDGFKVFYNIVSLSPFVKTIKIEKMQTEYFEYLTKCIHNGMIVNGYSLSLESNGIKSDRIPIIF